MLRKIMKLVGIETRGEKRRRLRFRLLCVHDIDLAEGYRSEFYDSAIEAKRFVRA